MEIQELTVMMNDAVKPKMETHERKLYFFPGAVW